MTTIAPTTRTRTAQAVAAADLAPAAPARSRRKRGAASTDTVFLAGPRKSGTMSVRERFSTLQKRFKPEAAKGVNVRFQFKLSGAGGGDWYVEIKDGKLTSKEGTGPNPTATLKASAADYKKIADGEMNKTLAFLRGKLKVDGDKDALGKWDSYFEKA